MKLYWTMMLLLVPLVVAAMSIMTITFEINSNRFEVLFKSFIILHMTTALVVLIYVMGRIIETIRYPQIKDG